VLRQKVSVEFAYNVVTYYKKVLQITNFLSELPKGNMEVW